MANQNLHQIPSRLQFSMKRAMLPLSSPEEEVPSLPKEEEQLTTLKDQHLCYLSKQFTPFY